MSWIGLGVDGEYGEFGSESDCCFQVDVVGVQQVGVEYDEVVQMNCL